MLLSFRDPLNKYSIYKLYYLLYIVPNIFRLLLISNIQNNL